MRKDFGVKTWIYPQPVLIIGTYDEDGTPNAMNAAWGAIYDDDQVVLCLSKCDYVGITSGNGTPDKVARAGFSVTRSSRVDAPLINELPLAMECELIRVDGEEHIIGRIVNVSCDESMLGEDGKPDYRKIRPITYDPVHFDYVVLGDKVGTAFSSGKALK